jgi:TolB-like protein/class 3 adenylate cyclase
VVHPDGPERKLAAILSADVVGYSRLMAEDEAGTIRTLTSYRNEIRALVSDHRGRVVDATGDNLLAEFPTALDAVECAVEVQRVLAARNAGLPEDHRMEFRIGVHMGDVSAEGDRLYGDGVNIAARLEGLAEPGGICISGEVHGQVERKLDIGLEDLGEQEVKNIPRAVRAYRVRAQAVRRERARPLVHLLTVVAAGLLVLVVVGGVLWDLVSARLRDPVSEEAFEVPGFDAPAIAVLPFDNLSGDPEHEPLALGIAEDLITLLASWHEIPVIARNSSFVYGDGPVDVTEVGLKLGARYLVEGSVRRTGDRVRITAQLIETPTARHIWAKHYDRGIEDVFGVQDEVTIAVVSSVYSQWMRSERNRALRKPPSSLNAWESYQRGLWHLFRWTREDVARARSLFEQSMELDPHWLEPIGLAAWARHEQIMRGWAGARDEAIAEIELLTQRCVALDAHAFGCQQALAWFYRLSGQPRNEVAAWERAVSANPSAPWAHFGLAFSLALTGRPQESIPHANTAMRLSPNDDSLEWGCVLVVGWAHFAAREYEDAVEWGQKAVDYRPDLAIGYRTLASSYAHLGQLDKARAALEEELRLDPGLTLAAVRSENPTSDPDFLERWLAGLRKAGLPEG